MEGKSEKPARRGALVGKAKPPDGGVWRGAGPETLMNTKMS